MEGKPMGLIAIISIFFVCLNLAGCITIQAPVTPPSYPIIGVFDDHNEVFRGRIYEKSAYGESAIELQGQVTGMKCGGSSYATKIPRDSVDCKGMEGDARVYCDDGRMITGTWRAIACRKGIAKGVDQNGNQLQFVYGMSDFEAQIYIERLAKLSANLPPVPPVYRPKETRKEKGFSTGTGFFVTEDGYIVTNYHVIEDATDVAVMTANGDLHKASLVRSDHANDLALIRIRYHSQPLVIGISSNPAKAEDVFTLGYPLVAIQGQEQKANFGKINALSGIAGDIRFLQIDVPIQAGNSGGPLFNSKGEVIGIVTATLDQLVTLQYTGSIPQNVGYAVKIDYTIGLLQGTLGNSWKRGEYIGKKTNLSELVQFLEQSVVLVIAR
jgi:S1-C subfamily serine protease